ncbi:hypothetical protein WJX81_006858 [Elliptochloris bilobata]|uniref:Uncharacterized protein n=1 Tax=Elliptochloris bilobata TaxID=381761 RepID=A0AAW1SIQ9_9CHLO
MRGGAKQPLLATVWSWCTGVAVLMAEAEAVAQALQPTDVILVVLIAVVVCYLLPRQVLHYYRGATNLRAATALDAHADWNAALAHALLFGAWAAAEGLAPPGDELAADPAWRLTTGLYARLVAGMRWGAQAADALAWLPRWPMHEPDLSARLAAEAPALLPAMAARFLPDTFLKNNIIPLLAAVSVAEAIQEHHGGMSSEADVEATAVRLCLFITLSIPSEPYPEAFDLYGCAPNKYTHSLTGRRLYAQSGAAAAAAARVVRPDERRALAAAALRWEDLACTRTRLLEDGELQRGVARAMVPVMNRIAAGTAASSYVFGEDPQRVAAAVGAVLPLAILAPAEALRCLVNEAVRDVSKGALILETAADIAALEHNYALQHAREAVAVALAARLAKALPHALAGAALEAAARTLPTLTAAGFERATSVLPAMLLLGAPAGALGPAATWAPEGPGNPWQLARRAAAALAAASAALRLLAMDPQRVPCPGEDVGVGPAPQRRAAVAKLLRRLASQCQALAAPPAPDAKGKVRGAAGSGPAVAQLLAQRCLAEAAGLAAALCGRYDVGPLGVLLLHLIAVCCRDGLADADRAPSNPLRLAAAVERAESECAGM